MITDVKPPRWGKFQEANLILIEWFQMFLAFYWAGALAWPGETFDRDAFVMMSQVMNEESWAGLFAMMGAAHLCALLFPRWHGTLPHLALTFLAAVVWGEVAVSISRIQPPAAPTAGAHILVAVGSIWMLWSMKVRPRG